ncbi:MAG TPA: response regulator [Candidatus Kryptobacter bacterium]|nr:response regulator [Candidatus Kryptobacter bacterium]
MTSLDSVDAELLSDAYGGEIHLLLADVIMPKMGGVELSRRINSRRSRMKTLYMSGYTSNDISGDGHPGEAFEFIQKPFRIQELARKVREILSR